MIDAALRGRARRLAATALCLLFAIPLGACAPNATAPALGTTANVPPEQSASAPSAEPSQAGGADAVYAPFSPAIRVTTARVIDPVRIYPEGDTWEDNVWTRAYRDKLGVTFSTLWSGEAGELNDAILAMAASGNLPDYMVLPYDTFSQLAGGNHLEPLDASVASFAGEDVLGALDAYGGAARKVASVRGALYGITSAPAREGLMMWYRDDWYAAVGKKDPPATLEELIELCYAFADDPMKTGEKITGLALCGNLFSGEANYPFGLEGFFSAFGGYPTQWQQESGELLHGSVHPGSRQALVQLQAMASDGVIDLGFAALDPWMDSLAMLYEGRAGLVFAPYWFAEWLESNRGASLRDKNTETWTCAPIPGASGAPNAVPTAARAGDVTCVRAGFAYPELAVKMVNLTRGLLEGDIAQTQYTSVAGKDNVNIITSFMAMAAGGDMGDNHRSEYASAVIGALETGEGNQLSGNARLLYARCKGWMDGADLTSYGIFSQYGPRGSQSVLSDMRARSLMMPDAYFGPSTISMNQDWLPLMEGRDAAYKAIIAGEGVEKAFDNYIRFFNENGGREITREVNDWFAAQ